MLSDALYGEALAVRVSRNSSAYHGNKLVVIAGSFSGNIFDSRLYGFSRFRLLDSLSLSLFLFGIVDGFEYRAEQYKEKYQQCKNYEYNKHTGKRDNSNAAPVIGVGNLLLSDRFLSGFDIPLKPVDNANLGAFGHQIQKRTHKLSPF